MRMLKLLKRAARNSDDYTVIASEAKRRSNHPSSFRDGPKDQTRNLEIPGSMLRIAQE
jgi:hypothetical protein